MAFCEFCCPFRPLHALLHWPGQLHSSSRVGTGPYVYFQLHSNLPRNDNMTDPADGTFIDDRESCTVQEAVAKLIGWMRGKSRLAIIRMNEDGGLVPEDLPLLPSLEGSVQDMLDRQWEAARRALRRVEEGGAPIELIKEKKEALLDVEETIQRAATYLIEIEDEIVLDTASRLILDESAEAKTGEMHITLSSLQSWALSKYGISIREAVAPDEAISEQEESPNRKLLNEGWLSPTKAGHLYTTLAFLVDAFADSRNIYKSKSGELFESNVANELAEMAKKANDGIRLSGQSKESILDRIEFAMRARRSKLPGRTSR